MTMRERTERKGHRGRTLPRGLPERARPAEALILNSNSPSIQHTLSSLPCFLHLLLLLYNELCVAPILKTHIGLNSLAPFSRRYQLPPVRATRPSCHLTTSGPPSTGSRIPSSSVSLSHLAREQCPACAQDADRPSSDPVCPGG